MQFNPYLVFNGRCEEAFKFYQQVLGGEIQAMMKWGESPMADQVPPESRDRIMHASLLVGTAALLGADEMSDSYAEPKGFSVALQIDDPPEAERIFGAFSENGTVTLPIQQTFWAARFGMLVDRFGIPWMINCSEPG